MKGGLLHTLVHMPGAEEAVQISRRFEASHHIPQILGLIDGNYLKVCLTTWFEKVFIWL